MRRAGRVAFLLFVGGLGAACSLTTSLDGLSGGPDPSDAAAGVDAPLANDALVASEASANDVATDAPQLPFCASQPATTLYFCYDFDDGKAVPGLFDDQRFDQGTIGEFTSTTARSSPRAFHSKTPAGDGSAGAKVAILRKDIADGARPIVFEFDTLFTKPPQGSSFGVAIAVVSFDPDVGYSFYVNDDGMQVYAQPNTTDSPRSNTVFPFGTWTHVRIEISPKKSNGYIHVFFDHATTPVLSNDAVSTPLPAGGFTNIEFRVGIERYIPPTPDLEIFVDNVTFQRN